MIGALKTMVNGNLARRNIGNELWDEVGGDSSLTA
jgi:hypothetical protein